jgi:hypothetical protein
MLQNEGMTHLSFTAWRWPWWLFLLFSLLLARSAVAADPLLDTDQDGIPDAWEVSVYHTDPNKADTDGDGHADREEILHGYNPLGPGLLQESDFDKDELSDRLELLFGTDPINPDTDGDGGLDGQEVTEAYSPTSTDPLPLQKSIVINLRAQRLEQRVANIPITSFLVSTGLPKTPTPVGTFKILTKIPRAWSRSASLWMPYWMEFSGRGHGIHELPEWPGGKKEGANHLGHLASHGCVRLGIGPAKQIYDWATIGTPVEIVRQ